MYAVFILDYRILYTACVLSVCYYPVYPVTVVLNVLGQLLVFLPDLAVLLF